MKFKSKQQIEALETALEETALYLRQLPRVPATSEIIDWLDQTVAWSRRGASLAQHGVFHNASGVELIRASLEGGRLQLLSSSPDTNKQELLKHLSEGTVTIDFDGIQR